MSIIEQYRTLFYVACTAFAFGLCGYIVMGGFNG